MIYIYMHNMYSMYIICICYQIHIVYAINEIWSQIKIFSSSILTLFIFIIQNAVEHLELSVNTNKMGYLLLFPRLRRGPIKN